MIEVLAITNDGDSSHTSRTADGSAYAAKFGARFMGGVRPVFSPQSRNFNDQLQLHWAPEG